MTHENAMRWYGFDPFSVRRKEDCTVGALRAAAAGHDVSIRSFDQGRYERSKATDLDTLAQQATACARRRRDPDRPRATGWAPPTCGSNATAASPTSSSTGPGPATP